MSIPLKAQTEASLRASGWSPGRVWDGVDAARPVVQAEGFRMSEAAVSFLREFGGLRIQQWAAEGRKPRWAVLDPAHAAQMVSAGWLQKYERYAKAQLSLVGLACDQYMAVHVVDDGRMFLSYDEEFYCIGDDGHDALNWLCIGPSYEVERPHLGRGR
jgi:hypothetical protein